MTKLKQRLQQVLLIVGLFIVGWQVFVFLHPPRHDRVWADETSQLPYAEVQESLVTLHHVRHWEYGADAPTEKTWETRTVDATAITDVWFVVDPYIDKQSIAHTMLMFDFKDGQSLVISVEGRKEKGESYSAVRGVFNGFELLYLWADAEEMLVRRALYLDAHLRMYKLQVSEKMKEKLFLGFVGKTNEINEKPEFYNTLLHNCTNELAHIANDVQPGTIPLNASRILTGQAAESLYDWGIIKSPHPWKDVREQAHVHTYIRENHHKDNWLKHLKNRVSNDQLL